ncbi:hypothetical protein, partial [Phytopseudomonas daroniae]|uniref:hypothetical protein n=1 Tax=Phytopseudomonas daroniae TaxID=2487519 RepID=UPI001ABF4C01
MAAIDTIAACAARDGAGVVNGTAVGQHAGGSVAAREGAIAGAAANGAPGQIVERAAIDQEYARATVSSIRTGTTLAAGDGAVVADKAALNQRHASAAAATTTTSTAAVATVAARDAVSIDNKMGIFRCQYQA